MSYFCSLAVNGKKTVYIKKLQAEGHYIFYCESLHKGQLFGMAKLMGEVPWRPHVLFLVSAFSSYEKGNRHAWHSGRARLLLDPGLPRKCGWQVGKTRYGWGLCGLWRSENSGEVPTPGVSKCHFQGLHVSGELNEECLGRGIL